MERLLNNEDNTFAALDDIKEDSVQIQGADLAFLKEKFGDQVDPKITLDEYIDFDIEVRTTHGKITNEEICTEVNEVQKNNLTMNKMKMIMMNRSQNQESKK